MYPKIHKKATGYINTLPYEMNILDSNIYKMRLRKEKYRGPFEVKDTKLLFLSGKKLKELKLVKDTGKIDTQTLFRRSRIF